ncbi:MAG TPA: hypothetical protein V6D03_13905 [Candidatus Caenarcaniphilales bacterium]
MLIQGQRDLVELPPQSPISQADLTEALQSRANLATPREVKCA